MARTGGRTMPSRAAGTALGGRRFGTRGGCVGSFGHLPFLIAPGRSRPASEVYRTGRTRRARDAVGHVGRTETQTLRPGHWATTTSAGTPSMTTSFWRLAAPATIRTSRRGMSQGVGEHPDERVVGGAFDRWRHDPDLQRPVDHAFDAFEPRIGE